MWCVCKQLVSSCCAGVSMCAACKGLPTHAPDCSVGQPRGSSACSHERLGEALWDWPLGMMDVMRRFGMFGMLPRVYLGCANRLGVSSA